MAKKKISLNAYLSLILAVLVLIYIFSFFNKPQFESRKAVKTALLNPKYVEEITQIQIDNKDNQLIIMQNSNGLWEIVDFENPLLRLPADSNKINNFLFSLSKVIPVYKLSSKDNQTDNYGLKDSSVYNFAFISGDQIISNLRFGKNDFTGMNRYVSGIDSSVIYETEDFMSSYLSVNVQNWSEPYIISRQIFGQVKPEDIQRVISNGRIYTSKDSHYAEYVAKLVELRQGGVVTVSELQENIVYSLRLELGNKNEITINVFNGQIESEFILQVIYDDHSTNVEYYSVISSWTLSRLKYEAD